MADVAHYTQLTDNPAAALPTIRSLATEMADASPGSLPNSAIVALARVCEHPIKPYRKQCNVTSRKAPGHRIRMILMCSVVYAASDERGAAPRGTRRDPPWRRYLLQGNREVPHGASTGEAGDMYNPYYCHDM